MKDNSKQIHRNICSSFNKAWDWIGRVNGLLFIIYSIIVLFLSLFLLMNEPKLIIRSFLLVLFFCVSICPLLMRLGKRFELKSIGIDLGKNNRFRWFTVFFCVSLAINLIRFLACYPGSFSNDNIVQLDQVYNNTYNDWHPVFQTLFAIKLPLTITGGWTGSISLFQILLFSGALSYACITLLRYSNKTYTLFIFSLVLLNPQVGSLVMSPMKDISFALGTIMLMSFSLNTYYSNGHWLKKPIPCISFIIVIVATTLFRHNAILFTLPLLIAVLVLVPIKQKTIIIISVILIIATIKIPIYTAIGVESPDKRQLESLGLPLTIIGAVVKDAPDSLDEETKEFAYQFAPEEVWQKNYEYGNFNRIKWNSSANRYLVEEYGAGRIILMMCRCFYNSPTISMKALTSLTEPVYGLIDDSMLYWTPSIYDNPYGIDYSGVERLQRYNEVFSNIVMTLFPHLFMYSGFTIYILLALILSKCDLRKKEDWKRIAFALPIFFYNFGSMLLLTDYKDASRFFFYTFIVVPIAMVLFIRKNDMSVKFC